MAHGHSHGHSHRMGEQSREIRRVTNIGLVFNIVIGALKIAVGVLGRSAALVADGIHSISDIATDVAVLAGVHFGSKGPDVKHPWGHGRMETFSAMAVGLTLALAGLGLVYHAAHDIVKASMREPSAIVIVVALASVAGKEWLYQITKRAAKKTRSAAAYANAWHHRSDALSSVAVLLGVGSMYLGFGYGDQIAAIVVGVMILMVGLGVLRDVMSEFAERAVDAQTQEQIEGVIAGVNGVRTWHKLRTRMLGREVFVDLHILVDPQLSITEAHNIAEKLEDELHEHMERPVNIIVHVEPDTPELREQRE